MASHEASLIARRRVAVIGGSPLGRTLQAMPEGDTIHHAARTGPALKRVGHKGADAIVAGNTTASFDAARAAGVEMIEFDVLPAEYRGDYATTALVLAHDYEHAAGAPGLEQGLAHLAGADFAGVELDVDLKLPGYEERVVAALRAHGLLERALVSTQYVESLAALRKLEPALRIGWSVPKLRRDYTQSALTAGPALIVLGAYRSLLPRRAAAALREGRCDALMAHHRLITPRLVGAVRAAGGELYAWTVDDAREIERLRGLGVGAVITNDPRLFTGG